MSQEKTVFSLQIWCSFCKRIKRKKGLFIIKTSVFLIKSSRWISFSVHLYQIKRMSRRLKRPSYNCLSYYLRGKLGALRHLVSNAHFMEGSRMTLVANIWNTSLAVKENHSIISCLSIHGGIHLFENFFLVVVENPSNPCDHKKGVGGQLKSWIVCKTK